MYIHIRIYIYIFHVCACVTVHVYALASVRVRCHCMYVCVRAIGGVCAEMIKMRKKARMREGVSNAKESDFQNAKENESMGGAICLEQSSDSS